MKAGPEAQTPLVSDPFSFDDIILAKPNAKLFIMIHLTSNRHRERSVAIQTFEAGTQTGFPRNRCAAPHNS